LLITRFFYYLFDAAPPCFAATQPRRHATLLAASAIFSIFLLLRYAIFAAAGAITPARYAATLFTPFAAIFFAALMPPRYAMRCRYDADFAACRHYATDAAAHLRLRAPRCFAAYFDFAATDMPLIDATITAGRATPVDDTLPPAACRRVASLMLA